MGAFKTSVEVIKAGFLDADAAKREQSYVSIEEVVVHGRGAFKGAVASKFAAACVPALCREVLCADDTKIDAEVRPPVLIPPPPLACTGSAQAGAASRNPPRKPVHVS